jgi:hypothetical protein
MRRSVTCDLLILSASAAWATFVLVDHLRDLQARTDSGRAELQPATWGRNGAVRFLGFLILTRERASDMSCLSLDHCITLIVLLFQNLLPSLYLFRPRPHSSTPTRTALPLHYASGRSVQRTRGAYRSASYPPFLPATTPMFFTADTSMGCLACTKISLAPLLIPNLPRCLLPCLPRYFPDLTATSRSVLLMYNVS